MDIILQDSTRAAVRPPVVERSRLQPGDLVLTSPRTLKPSSALIRTWQKVHGYLWDDARWTHVGIYAGNGFVIEATPPVIRKIELSIYVADHLLRFRRSPHVTSELGTEIVAVAEARLHRPYSYAKGVKVSRPARKIARGEERAFNCASLYADCFNIVMNDVNHELWTVAADEIKLPAELSRTNELVDVAAGWSA